MAIGVDSRWFRRYAPAGAVRRRLVCLPHAGGSAGFFHGWGRAAADGTLPSGVEVLTTRYPGRQERLEEPAIDSVERLADEVTAALLPFTDTPLTLFGHSMGSSVGYEVALRLESGHGIRLDALVVSARKAPHQVTPKDTYLRGDEALLEEIRGIGGTDTALLDHPELRALVLPALRADFKAVGTYGPRPPVPVGCPVTGLVGDRDPRVSVADVRAWAAVAPAGFDLTVLPGDHFYLVQQREAVLRALAAHLG
ncbi:thioesterase II family protein [Streptomyces sp. NEAU-Y11]|uniref:thioesterase II family protein n=1 Tax=Streptomyces cucumeris TaxID=2962890 RepID=UPI0020C8EDF7|nr:alpha/beta fold hydrolase [Streptomyces sp. NEAU-Y11]MCP9206868.1 alpha/beta fold hydrolase [Streptomyces sp. NEAU-Y11]